MKNLTDQEIKVIDNAFIDATKKFIQISGRRPTDDLLRALIIFYQSVEKNLWTPILDKDDNITYPNKSLMWLLESREILIGPPDCFGGKPITHWRPIV